MISEVGYRFRPSDLDLIAYLEDYHNGLQFSEKEMTPFNIYELEPWAIRDILVQNGKLVEDGCMYCLTLTKRRERKVGIGFWHASSKPKYIFDEETKKLVGETRTLVYYTGTPDHGSSTSTRLNGKTNWIMHEYILVNAERSINQSKGMRVGKCIDPLLLQGGQVRLLFIFRLVHPRVINNFSIQSWSRLRHHCSRSLLVRWAWA
ncbi:hypothetical protein Sjap_025787 [Stephania japonica]|uniref:NAC domain-containing protein n=1 Tax=Stephania japonica TaxID=461633 RepID=A0AAP0E2E3_9MAGN